MEIGGARIHYLERGSGPPDGEGMRAHRPDLRLETIAGGHMIPLTAPDRVAAFVREVDRSTRAAGESRVAGAA
jgi:pimeloyl-ACP methyl ester carboxylesterase